MERHLPFPFHTAALYASTEIMAALLDAGADIEALPECKEKAIDIALKAKRPEMVKFLSERGAEAPALADYSRPDDSWAKAERWYKAVKTADELHDGTGTKNVESLCRAVRQGNVEAVTLLLHKRRTNVNTFDKHGYSPLHWSALEGNIEIMKILLDNGADLELLTTSGSPPLFWAVWHFILNGKRAAKGLPIERNATLDAMLFLLERGANINAVSVVGSSLLHTAARNGEIELMRVLLDKSADIESEDENALTPLFYAIRASQLDAVKFLLERGAKVNNGDIADGRTPLHYAALGGETRIMRVLLDAGADGTARDDNGKMASHYTKKGYPVAMALPQKRKESKETADVRHEIEPIITKHERKNLAQRLKQSMELLQLTLQQLEQRIDQELEQNPMLE